MSWQSLMSLLLLLSPLAHSQVITTSVGDRTVRFKLVQQDKKAVLDVHSNEIGDRKLAMNAVNENYFKKTVKDACTKSLYEAGCYRYSIDIERQESGRTIRCVFCYNSDVRQAKVARDALQVLSMAVSTAE